MSAQTRRHCSRVRDGDVDAAAHCGIDRRALRRAPGAQLGVEHPEADGVLASTPEQIGARAQRARHPALEIQEMARLKKVAARQRRIIVFIDESGLSERPCRARTWAPKGETPVLQYAFGWKHLSVIAGASFVRFYFRFFPGSIKAPQIVEFLRALRASIGRRLLSVWDGLRAHRSRLVSQYVAAQRGAIAVEFLPPYAPELNPVEYIWG